MTAHSVKQTTQQTAHYTTDRWAWCYGRGWGGELVKEAFAHPAKVSFLLAQRIYQHALEAGFIERGGAVIDPFGGVGGFAYGALFAGLQWVGVELEEKFVGLGRANIAMWNERYGATMPRWGRATLLQGDSRKLLEVVGHADLVVSSPPYAQSLKGDNGAEATRKRIAEGKYRGLRPDVFLSENQASKNTFGGGYSDGPDNLCNLPPGNLDMVISSPPFGEAHSGEGGILVNGINGDMVGERTYRVSTQGQADGQLAALPLGSFDAVVGSPPFEDSNQSTDADFLEKRAEQHRNGSRFQPGLGDYGNTEGQIGAAHGETFWSAARLIVEQCYLALKPGGHAIWVTKRYVKGGKIVEFTEQWVRLCESVGFVMTCHHHAMLVEEVTRQGDIFGGVQSKRKERKSFFRRIAERKGSPRIDWEDVVCMVKPA